MLQVIRKDPKAVSIFLSRHVESCERIAHGYKTVLKPPRPQKKRCYLEDSDSEYE